MELANRFIVLCVLIIVVIYAGCGGKENIVDATIHANLARRYEEQGKLDEAIREYEKAAKLAPNTAWILNNLAWVYFRKGVELEAAVSLAEKSVELRPDSILSLDTLGWLYCETGQYERALSVCERLMTLEPKNPFAWRIVSEVVKSDIESEIFLGFCHDVEDIVFESELQAMLSEFYRSKGNDAKAQEALDKAEKAYTRLGFPRESNWLVIGPFDNPDDTGLAIPYPPETEIDFSKSYQGKVDDVSWQEPSDGRGDGRLCFEHMLAPNENSIAYAFIQVSCPEHRSVQLRIGSDDGVKVWLNGEVVWTKHATRSLWVDNDIVPVELREGENHLLFKVDQGDGGWGLVLRITDRAGMPMEDIRYHRTSMD